MEAKARTHQSNILTPTQAATVAAIREQLQREKPSLAQAVASGEYQPPVTTGEYFDIVKLLTTLKDLRLKCRMSLRECAEISGIDYAALSRLENGVTTNPTVHTLARCARALGKRMQIALIDAERPIVVPTPPKFELPKSAFMIGSTLLPMAFSDFTPVNHASINSPSVDSMRLRFSKMDIISSAE